MGTISRFGGTVVALTLTRRLASDKAELLP